MARIRGRRGVNREFTVAGRSEFMEKGWNMAWNFVLGEYAPPEPESAPAQSAPPPIIEVIAEEALRAAKQRRTDAEAKASASSSAAAPEAPGLAWQAGWGPMADGTWNVPGLRAQRLLHLAALQALATK